MHREAQAVPLQWWGAPRAAACERQRTSQLSSLSFGQQNHDFDGSVETFEELAAECRFPWCDAPAAGHRKLGTASWGLRSTLLLLQPFGSGWRGNAGSALNVRFTDAHTSHVCCVLVRAAAG